MNKQFIRYISKNTSNYEPGFLKTFNAATKPAQKQSFSITKPFGLEKPILLNHKLSDTYSFSNIYQELFGEQAKERRAKQINYDLKHSPLFDSKSFRNTNGKIFNSPISYFKQEKSLYFPDFITKTLTGESRSLYDVLVEKKVSIITLFSTGSGYNCVQTWFKEDGKDLYKDSSFEKENPNAQIIDINLPQSWLKGFITKYFALPNIKKMLPELRQNNYFILPNHIFSFNIKEKLYCDNQCSGYIYIVDSMGKIRWAASGNSTPEEYKLMWKTIKNLQK
ncbi:unnamed protein product [Candida verbasci]|uniref:Thioredoxin domain-containing protein n=1 Tax=Candida verbasci TaxID=1227364 RepID=A0A9W4TSW4_9ASCO|nr:unnamed protein product [Candida verbasci]